MNWKRIRNKQVGIAEKVTTLLHIPVNPGGGEEEKGIETDSIWHFSNNMWIVFKKQKCLLEFGSATTVPASKEQKLHWQRVEVGEFSRCEHPGISQNGLTFFVHDKNISIVQIGDTFYFLHWCFVPCRDSNNKTGKNSRNKHTHTHNTFFMVVAFMIHDAIIQLKTKTHSSQTRKREQLDENQIKHFLQPRDWREAGTVYWCFRRENVPFS